MKPAQLDGQLVGVCGGVGSRAHRTVALNPRP